MELKDIEDSLLSARKDSGCGVIITGAEGTGKSTFLDRLADRFLHDGVVTLRIAGKSSMSAPFAAIRQGIKEFRESIGGVSLPPIALSGVSLDVNISAESVRALENILADLRSISRTYHPLIVAFDDIDLADLGTQQFFAYLSRVISTLPISFVSTAAGTGRLSSDLREEIKAGNIRVIKIPPMSDEEISAIVKSKGLEISPGQIREADGNPMKALEIAKGSESAVKDLTEKEIEVLSVMHVYGNRIHAEILSELVNAKEEELVGIVEGLIAKDILKEETGDEISISHATDIKALEKEISIEKRKELSERIIDLLNRGRYRNKPEQYAGILSRLYQTAGEYDLSLRCGRLHMESLMRGYAVDDAVKAGRAVLGIFEKSSDTDENRSLCISTMMDLGTLLDGKGEREEAIKMLENAMEKSEAWKYNTMKIHVKLGRIYFGEGEYGKALEEYSKALNDAGENEMEYRALINNYIGHIYEMEGRYVKALEYYNKGMEISKNYHIDSELAHSLHRIGTVYYYLGNLDKGEELLSKAEIIRGRLGLLREQGYSLNNLGIIEDMRGNVKKAMEYYQRARAIGEKISDLSAIITGNTNIATIYTEMGKFDQATEIMNENLVLARKLNEPYAMALDYFNFSGIYEELEDYDKALEHGRLALEYILKHDLTYLLSDAYSILAEIAAKKGDFASSEEYLNLAEHAYKNSPKHASEAMLKNSRALYYQYRGEYGKADALYLEVINIYKGLSLKSSMALAYEQYGDLMHLMNKDEDALKYYTEAKRLYSEMDNSYRIAREDAKIAKLKGFASIYYKN